MTGGGGHGKVGGGGCNAGGGEGAGYGGEGAGYGGAGAGLGAAASQIFIGIGGGGDGSGHGGDEQRPLCCPTPQELCAIGICLAFADMVTGLILLAKALSKNHSVL